MRVATRWCARAPCRTRTHAARAPHGTYTPRLDAVRRSGAAQFREGEDAHEMYIITSGRVQVALQGKDGRTHTIG